MYFSRLGNFFDWVIIVVSTFILIDFLVIEYRRPDLSRADAEALA